MTSENSSKTWRDQLQGIGIKRARLELFTSWIGATAVKKHAEMSRRNQEAENRHVRKSLWGNNGGPEDEEMGDTYLGDVTIQQSKKSIGPALAMAAGFLIPGAGVAGYLINQALTKPDPPAVSQPFEDSSVSISLGRIEDYDTN